MKNHLLILVMLLTILSCGLNRKSHNQELHTAETSIDFVQIKSDSLFQSNQIISLLTLPEKDSSHYNIKFEHSQLDLKRTSSFAMKNKAIAGINGGFFNMDSGGSTTYFEVNDIVINKTNNTDKKQSKPNPLMNGAIVITNDFDIIIQPANSEQFYESSKKESAVLITGPLLLLDSEVLKLPNRKFVNNRHPRTCLCETKESVIFITIDGRRKEAQGMSLIEAQRFLSTLGCINAINLDGGGSTTMWIKGKGVVNFPSDNSGERPVSNVLLISNR